MGEELELKVENCARGNEEVLSPTWLAGKICWTTCEFVDIMRCGSGGH